MTKGSTALSGLQRLLIWSVAALMLLAFGPAASGYAWAIGWLPAYGAVCHLDKILGSNISPEGYRIFLLDHGCDVDVAIRDIVTTSGSRVDPTRVVAIYHGAQHAESPDELLATDMVQRGFSNFARLEPSDGDCRPGQYCALPDPSHGLIETWVSEYMSSARSQFVSAVDDGADYVAWLTRMGGLVQAAILLLYAMATLLLAKWVVIVVTGRLRRSKGHGGLKS